MNENTQVNSENTAPARDIDDWSDIDPTGEVDESEDSAENAQEQADSAEDTASESEKADQQTQKEDGADKEAPKTEEPKQTDQFTLKHLDEVKTVSRDEVIAYAQKGMDYDRIKQKYDELTAPTGELSELLKAADAKNVSELLDRIKVSALVESGVDEAVAKRQVQLDRKERELTAKEAAQAAEKSAKESSDAKIKADIDLFIKKYPDVKIEDVPKEVWDKVDSNKESLASAYAEYRAEKAEKELAAAKQNAENKARSTGSRTTDGNQSKADKEDSMWYEEHKPKHINYR